ETSVTFSPATSTVTSALRTALRRSSRTSRKSTSLTVTFLPPSNSTSCDSPTFRSTVRISGVRVGFGGSAGSRRGKQNKERRAISNRLFMGAFLVESLFVALRPVGEDSLLRRGAGHNCLSDYRHGVRESREGHTRSVRRFRYLG